ncbi:MAG TPA: alpha/beta fold hydrolase [Vicinamibacterales bacterium]|jgi:pimeloyl-ACP methyl ester carboxylesterase
MRHTFQHRDHVISYHDVRSPGAPDAGTILFLHAFPLDAGMWQPQLDALPAGWRAIAPDLRGFGKSLPDHAAPARNSSAPPSIDDYVDNVIALLDHLGIDTVVVSGLSMGGYAAFGLLRRAPARLRGLVLADTRADADTEAARANRASMLDLARTQGSAAVVERMLPTLLGGTTRATRPAVVERVRVLASAQSPDAVAAAIERLRDRPDSTPLLPGIACPTLVMAGDEDTITGVDVARQMHGRIPGADLEVIPEAGHLSNLEQPAAFNAALARFLQARFEA